MPDVEQQFFSLEDHVPSLAGGGWRGWLRGLLEGICGIRGCRRLIAELAERVAVGAPSFGTLLELGGVGLDAQGVLESIPAKGPVMLIANHPFGGADALVLGALATAARGDVRVLANSEVAALPGMGEFLLPLEIMDREGAGRRNLGTLRKGVSHLRDGGVLVVFPAGAVAHWRWESGRVEDPPWPMHTARILMKARVPVLPVRFFGSNGPLFQMLGACHPLLRSALLCRAFLAMRGRTVTCRAGVLRSPPEGLTDPEELTAMLRKEIDTLGDLDCGPARITGTLEDQWNA